MEIGSVRIAEDADFEKLKNMLSLTDGWQEHYHKGQVQVWAKDTQMSPFKMIKVTFQVEKVKAVYKNVPATLLYDVLLDPDYRKVWDTYMVESYDIGYLNPSNDIGYYAVKCPSPLKNRDFVLHRSWLDTGREYLIVNHSVYHEVVPPKKGLVRAISYLTGFVVRPLGVHECELNYVTQCDPKGSLPSWVVNKLTQMFAPKMVKRLYKACYGYDVWKKKHNPDLKPWIYPEQMKFSPKIKLDQCVQDGLHQSTESIDESSLTEDSLKTDNYISDDDS